MTTPDTNHNNPDATENRFTGLYPDNDYPLVDGQLDFEQEKRQQARDESERTKRVSSNTAYAAHPPFTVKGPDAVLAEQNAQP